MEDISVEPFSCKDFKLKLYLYDGKLIKGDPFSVSSVYGSIFSRIKYKNMRISDGHNFLDKYIENCDFRDDYINESLIQLYKNIKDIENLDETYKIFTAIDYLPKYTGFQKNIVIRVEKK